MTLKHYRPDNYTAKSSIGYMVRRTTSMMVEALEPIAATGGLTFTQWVVLMHMRDGAVVNPRDICTLLRHDSGAITRVIDQLEERGLVHRQRSLEDRRAVALSLTPEGNRVIESLIPAVCDKLNFALRDFSPGEVAELSRLLTKLMATMSTPAVVEGEVA